MLPRNRCPRWRGASLEENGKNERRGAGYSHELIGRSKPSFVLAERAIQQGGNRSLEEILARKKKKSLFKGTSRFRILGRKKKTKEKQSFLPEGIREGALSKRESSRAVLRGSRGLN